jgi:hypothetical protein
MGQVVLQARAPRSSFRAPNVIAVRHGDICFWDIALQAAQTATAQTATTGRILADGLLWPITFTLKPARPLALSITRRHGKPRRRTARPWCARAYRHHGAREDPRLAGFALRPRLVSGIL